MGTKRRITSGNVRAGLVPAIQAFERKDSARKGLAPKKTWMPGIKPGMTDRKVLGFPMRPALLNPLFAPVTSLSGVGPKQDKLFRYLLGRDDTPRLLDLVLHLPSQVIDRRARPKIQDAVPGTIVTLEVTVDQHRPPPPRNPRAPHLVYV